MTRADDKCARETRNDACRHGGKRDNVTVRKFNNKGDARDQCRTSRTNGEETTKETRTTNA